MKQYLSLGLWTGCLLIVTVATFAEEKITAEMLEKLIANFEITAEEFQTSVADYEQGLATVNEMFDKYKAFMDGLDQINASLLPYANGDVIIDQTTDSLYMVRIEQISESATEALDNMEALTSPGYENFLRVMNYTMEGAGRLDPMLDSVMAGQLSLQELTRKMDLTSDQARITAHGLKSPVEWGIPGDSLSVYGERLIVTSHQMQTFHERYTRYIEEQDTPEDNRQKDQ